MTYQLDSNLVHEYQKKMEELGKLSNLFSNIDGKAMQEGFNRCVTSMMQMAIDATDILHHIDTAPKVVYTDATAYRKNIAGKMTNLLSKVQGTAYEWQTYVKHMNKRRFVIPDINNNKDPDLRVWDGTDEYEKIIELKTSTSTDKTKLKESVTAQLASAINQLTQRETKFPGKYRASKFKAGIEINSNFIGQMIINDFKSPTTPTPTSEHAYNFFLEVITNAMGRGGVTVKGLDKLYGNAFSPDSVDYEVVSASGKRRIKSSTHKETFQIDFKFGTPVKISLVGGSDILAEKMKFLIYSNDNATAPATKELYVYQIAYLTSSNPMARYQYDSGSKHLLLSWT